MTDIPTHIDIQDVIRDTESGTGLPFDLTRLQIIGLAKQGLEGQEEEHEEGLEEKDAEFSDLKEAFTDFVDFVIDLFDEPQIRNNVDLKEQADEIFRDVVKHLDVEWEFDDEKEVE